MSTDPGVVGSRQVRSGATVKTESDAARAVRIPILLFTGFLALYLATAPGRISGTDAWTRYLVAVGLVEYGQPVLPPSKLPGSHWVVYGRDGAAHSYFGIGQSLAFAPLYLLGKTVRHVTGSATSDWPAVLASFLGSLVAALLAVAVFTLARQIGYTSRVALGTAALCGVGTTVWDAARDNHDHLLEALGVTASLAALLFGLRQRSKGAMIGAGALYGYALMTRLSATFGLAGIALLLALGVERPPLHRGRPLDAAWLGLGVAPAVGFVLWYNSMRFGNLFLTGYETKPLYWFGSPIYEGVATLLVSPGSGVLWYVPLVLATPLLGRWSYERVPGSCLGLGVIGLGYLLGYGQFQGLGLGVWTWGPKYLLPLMPLIAVAWAEALARWGALLRPTRFALAGLIAVSVAVQILSASVSPLRTASLAMAAGVAGDPDIVWRPEWSPLLNQGANVINAVRHLRPGTPLESLAGPVEPERRLARDLGLNTFDWWWMRAWYKGVTGIWIAPLVLAAIAAGSVWRLWRLTAGPARR